MSLLDALAQLDHLSQQLEQTLEREFDVLKASDLEAFERLQIEKGNQLDALSDPNILEFIQSLQSNAAVIQKEGQAASSLWADISGRLANCRELHQRNELVISRKLDTVRAALEAIKSPNLQNSVETYDRLGRLGGRGGKGTLGSV